MKRNAVAWVALIVSTAALASSWGVSRPLPAAPKVTAESQKTAHALSEAFNTVAEFVKPSVVQISVTKKGGANAIRRGRNPFQGPNGPNFPNGPQNLEPKDFEEMLKRFFGPGGRPEREQFGRGVEGVGSGFVYDDRGHIVTNNHVVEDANKITVTFYDGVEATAKVVGTDPQTDVAVIKVENTDYRPLPKGVSGKLKVGEMVMAVGSPYRLDQSVTTGIVSATDRNDLGINDVPNAYESFIQTDAAINPGNSGGPLVNMDGEVIGVNSAIMTGGRGNDGVGFTIPMDLASTIADNLIKHGKVRRSRVGIALEPLSPVMARQFGLDPKVKGVVVGQVVPGSPAEKAGLKSGDVLTAFNGNPIASLPSFRLLVASTESGREIPLSYWREGKSHSATIVPAPADQVVFDIEKNREKAVAEDEKKEENPKTDKVEVADFGLEVQALTPELAAHFGHKKDAQGLLVSDVKEGSPAADEGIEPGMLISRIVKNKRSTALTTVKDFQELAGKSDELAVYVETPRGGGHYVTLTKPKK
jgi:serine protease Do